MDTVLSTKICFILCFLLNLVEFYQCARYGGSRRGGGGGSTRRPYTTSRPYSSTYRTYSSTYTSSDSLSSRRPQSTTARSYYESSKPTYTVESGKSNNIGWNVPARPGNFHTTDHYQGPQQIKIVNKYNYHYPGYYSLPVQNHANPGYYYTPSTYSYGIGDTGGTALGFFLGYSLAKITTPTYSHYSFYDGYRPRYDHYEVHHYYHNKDAIPQKQEIQSNTIVGCVGDSVTICPVNTTSLCTSNGALMCVVSATSTIQCNDDRKINCVTSTIACINNTVDECKNSNANSTTIKIPCISNAQINGNVKYVNNTIVPYNETNNNNGTTSVSTQLPVNTTPSSSQYLITTPQLTQNSTSTTFENANRRKKRETVHDFCITIVALPAKKKETAGELVLKDAQFIVEKFIESIWNL